VSIDIIKVKIYNKKYLYKLNLNGFGVREDFRGSPNIG